MKYFICFCVFLWCNKVIVRAQSLKPGFNVDEYLEVLERCAGQNRNVPHGSIPMETNFTKVYDAPESGLHNKWSLWLSNDKTTIAINLRGTTGDLDSWLENFYSAMIPAAGSLKISDSYTFEYKFASDPRALVHTGWTIGVGSMIQDIMPMIRKNYAMGVRNIIVEGHSQGAALSFLLSSYLHYQVLDGKLPVDLVIKTWCSAAPKPGNLYYAYDFDYINRGGWANTVVSSIDWVPETPFTEQTLRDVSHVNPFTGAKKLLRKQKNLLVRMYTLNVYNQLNNSTGKSQRKYDKYLGRAVAKQVKKYLPGFEPPHYSGSSNYTAAGNRIVLVPDTDYYNHFPDTGSNIFRNHLFEPYYYLVKKEYK